MAQVINQHILICRYVVWLAAVLLLPGAVLADPTNNATEDKVRSTQDFARIRQEIETLRGRKFTRDVPVYKVSAKELRAISNREIDKQYPGSKLPQYEQLLAWLDMVPPSTDLKIAEGNFFADQVAGLYDSDTKEMCIPTSPQDTNSRKRAAEKKLEEISPFVDDIVLAHEFTHALEDQYWPLDDPRDNDTSVSSDRGTAHAFLNEGSATREMTEAIPAEMERNAPGAYFLLWNLIHSGFGEFLLNYAFSSAWKGSDAVVEGVPETLARTEAMPYAFGYTFCTKIMRQWGLDGLDYVYDHPPVSSEQVMHPKKYWEWRDFPVQINLPETLAGGWKQVTLDCVGEAGIAVLFGCQLTNLNRGLELARGWDGDHAALFEGPGAHKLLLWASSWDSTNAAGHFVGACIKQRQIAHRANLTTQGANRIEWRRPDGRAGFIFRDGRRVILLETDQPESLRNAESLIRDITFIEPPEDKARAAANPVLRRFNPIWSSQVDGDYAITRSLCGLLSRHDRNAVGAADSFAFGMLAESRRTTSFHKWELGGGLLAKHESDTRRGITATTVLPCGILASSSSARLPYAPGKTIKRASLVWGLAGSISQNDAGVHSIRILPFGILLSRTKGSAQESFHILATGVSRAGSVERFRLFGIPIRTRRNAVGTTAHL